MTGETRFNGVQRGFGFAGGGSGTSAELSIGLIGGKLGGRGHCLEALLINNDGCLKLARRNGKTDRGKA